MISIILQCYDQIESHRHMTMACLANIRKFTDLPYEIIIVDNEPKFPIRDEYKVLNLNQEKIIENKKDKGCYASYNQGAKKAKGEYLIFIQNDVFVHERTINKLVEYLEQYDLAFPQQIPLKREQVKELLKNKNPSFGWREAGMLAIRKEGFERVGGWDERFKWVFGEKAFYLKCEKAGLTWTCQTNALITHITAATTYTYKTIDPQRFQKGFKNEAPLIQEYQ